MELTVGIELELKSPLNNVLKPVNPKEVTIDVSVGADYFEAECVCEEYNTDRGACYGCFGTEFRVINNFFIH